MKDFQAGTYRTQLSGYRSFSPNPINRQWVVDDPGLITLLGEADRLIGSLDMYSRYVPDVDLFIKMHVVVEATTSSRIEGTKTNIQEALMEERDLDPEKRDDWKEVQNYIVALNFAIAELERLPLSSRLIRETHRILLSGARGANKMPGEFRQSQNWIGGVSLKDAAFIPPHHSEVPELMSDLEKFIHNKDIPFPPLLKIALIHYQFETIHPFLDGNGRMGRLLITLFMVHEGLLHKPILYLSDFLDRHRQLYFDHLSNVRANHQIDAWFRFFLTGVIETARKASATLDEVMRLRQKLEGEQLLTLGVKATKARILLDHLYRHPIVDAAEVAAITGYSLPTAYKLIESFQRLGILSETTGFQRNRKFLFRPYVELFLG